MKFLLVMTSFFRFGMIWLVIFIMVGQCHCCRNLSCVSVSSTVKCHEDAHCLLLHWSEMIPYAYLKDGETSPRGILIGVAKTLLEHCCDSCWPIQETLPVNFTDFYYKKPEFAGLSLPYLMSAADYHYLANYVAVIKDPTSAFVKKKDGWKTLYKNLMATIRDGWSVLVIILVFSWISGMIIWLMEMWFNEEQFPRKFLRGSWEGFWWAFVSMTTVGYGDRAPRTLLGRVFAIFWILIGICICSIFTATLTSSLTMNSFANQNTITRTKVGVMINSMEAITAIQNQADVIYYNSSDELFDAVQNDEVEGVLFDYYYALVHEKDLTSDDLIIANIFEPKDWSLGFKLLSKELAECMREEYYHNYAKIFYEAVLNESIPEPSKIVSKSQLSGIFDPDGVLFAMILYICAGGALCIFIAGLCWDLVCQRKKIGPKSEKVKKLENMEKELMAELQTFFMSWKERMASTKEASNCLDTLETKA